MKVAIYDTEHFETVYALINIWRHSNNQIYLFIPPEVEQPLKDMIYENTPDIEWIIKRGSNLDFLRKMKQYINDNKLDLLIINTVTYHHLLLAWICQSLTIPIILTVHDANTTFNPRIQFNIRSFFRYIGKKILIKNVTAYATLLSSTKDYIEKNFIKKRPIYIFPGSVFIENKFQPINDIMKIVSPGTIDEGRRDYNQVIELLELLKNNKAEFVLLGASKTKAGKRFTNIIRQQASESLLIKTFNKSFVPQLEYDLHLAEADFIFLPLIKSISTNEKTTESYGHTKASGAFFDAVKFGKCIFVPDYIQIPPELIKQCYSYNTIKEIVEILIDPDPSFKNELKYKAWRNSFNFSTMAVRERLAFNKAPHEENGAS